MIEWISTLSQTHDALWVVALPFALLLSVAMACTGNFLATKKDSARNRRAR